MHTNINTLYEEDKLTKSFSRLNQEIHASVNDVCHQTQAKGAAGEASSPKAGVKTEDVSEEEASDDARTDEEERKDTEETDTEGKTAERTGEEGKEEEGSGGKKEGEKEGEKTEVGGCSAGTPPLRPPKKKSFLYYIFF